VFTGLFHGFRPHDHVTTAWAARHALTLVGAVMSPMSLPRPGRDRRGLEATDGFGERLKRAMADAGIGNPELARAVGVHRFTVTFWRSGKQRPHHLAIRVIARVLGVRTAWLRAGVEPMHSVGKVERQPRTITPAPSRPVPEVSWTVARWMQAELADYACAGVGSDEVDAVEWLLRSPEIYPLYVGGGIDPQADDSRPALRAIAAHARAMLRSRGYLLAAESPH
jgi:DNA-binding XRE family transcriptional regulator